VPRSRKRGAIPPLPQYVSMAWCLVKHRDFTFLMMKKKKNGKNTKVFIKTQNVDMYTLLTEKDS
jgi:hypothetical protein